MEQIKIKLKRIKTIDKLAMKVGHRKPLKPLGILVNSLSNVYDKSLPFYNKVIGLIMMDEVDGKLKSKTEEYIDDEDKPYWRTSFFIIL